MSAFIEQGEDGKLYIEERVRTEYFEAKKLYDYNYSELLKQDGWELYSAICYLAGFDYFDDRYHFIAKSGEMEIAFKKLNKFYPIFIKIFEKRNKESISNYPQVSPSHWIRKEQMKVSCYVKPCEFLEHAILNEIKLPDSLLYQSGLFQMINSRENSFFVSGDKCEKFTINDESRLSCRASAKVLWHYDNGLSKAEIRKILKNGSFLKNGSGVLYHIPAENAFNRWMKGVDPTGISSKRGCRSRKQMAQMNNSPFKGSLCADVYRPFKELDYWQCAFNFRKLRMLLKAFTQTLLYKDPHLACDSIFSHPIVHDYVGCFYGISEKIVCKWIQEEFPDAIK
jgi:hypothetical protein